MSDRVTELCKAVGVEEPPKLDDNELMAFTVEDARVRVEFASGESCRTLWIWVENALRRANAIPPDFVPKPGVTYHRRALSVDGRTHVVFCEAGR